MYYFDAFYAFQFYRLPFSQGFHVKKIIIVSPERSSRDTMDLRSFRVRVRVRVRRVRRVRTDFLVNVLQARILDGFSSNLVCV